MTTPASLRFRSARCRASPLEAGLPAPRIAKRFGRGNRRPAGLRLTRHPFETWQGTGIITRFPSGTAFALPLGADLPWADDLYPGNLRLSADGDLTRLFVYSYLHSLFHYLQHTSQYTFISLWNAPLPSHDRSWNPRLRLHA